MFRSSHHFQAFVLYAPRAETSLSLGRRPLPPPRQHLRRSTSSLPPPLPPLLPPSAVSDALLDVSSVTGTPWGIIAAGFVGFPLVLWAYKCMMLVVFQRKIIYMGYLPPLARTTKIDPKDRLLRGVDLDEVEIESEEGITLRGISLRKAGTSTTANSPDICLVYFQGNLGSPLSRLPLFSHLLLSTRHSPFSHPNPSTVLLTIPPRSYYLSTPSAPSQRALLRDYLAVLTYARTTYPDSKIVLYGHSLGGAAACVLLGSLPPSSEGNEGRRLVDALVLENPFPSVPIMITESLYPSRWLPYHYLTGFVLDKWDALGALKERKKGGGSALDETDVLFVSGEKDGLVRPELVRRMYEAGGGVEERARGDDGVGQDGGRTRGKGRRSGRREWMSIKAKSHDDAWMAKGEWGAGVRGFLQRSGVLEAKETSRKKEEP